LPLVGMARALLAAHQPQPTRQPLSRERRGPFDQFSVEVDQIPVASDPAPDEELAAIADAPQPAADVLAREPDVLPSDPAEQGRGRRPDDPDVVERHKVIGVLYSHGHGSPFPESAPSTRGGSVLPLAQSRCGALNGLAAVVSRLTMTAQRVRSQSEVHATARGQQI